MDLNSHSPSASSPIRRVLDRFRAEGRARTPDALRDRLTHAEGLCLYACTTIEILEARIAALRADLEGERNRRIAAQEDYDALLDEIHDHRERETENDDARAHEREHSPEVLG